MTDKNLNDLHPTLQPLATQFLDACAMHSIKAVIVQTWRTPQEQDALYAQGRTAGGTCVTNATSAQSKHCFTINGEPASKAFDFMLLDEQNRIITDGGDHAYAAAGNIGKNLGLTWGGDWHHPDFDHFEIA